MSVAFRFVAKHFVGFLREILAQGFQVRTTRPFLEQGKRAATVRRVLGIDQFRQDERLQLFGRTNEDNVGMEHRWKLRDIVASDERHLQE